MNNWLLRTLQFATLTAVAGTALMQAEQATFHLPVAAHWGNAVLAPGDYRMELPDLALGHPQFRVEGDGKAVYALPKVTDFTRTSNSNYLKLSEVDGEYYVCGYTSGLDGKEYTFFTPKRVPRWEASKSNDLVPVAATN